MKHGGPCIPNALPPEEMSADDRLDEVAALLAEGLVRARMRRRRKLRKLAMTRENELEEGRILRTHGLEPSRNGEQP